MKYLNFLILTSLFFIMSSCSVDSPEEHLSESWNSETRAVITKNNRIVKSSVIKSKSNERIVGITITNKESDITFPVIYHRLTSSDKKEISNSDTETFNGSLTIEIENRVVKKYEVKDGKIISSGNFNQIMNGEYDCSIEGIVECADDEINDKNAIEYLFCLASAPLCLAEVYASCTYDNC